MSLLQVSVESVCSAQSEDLDYINFEDALLSQDLGQEELQRFYLKRKSALRAAERASERSRGLQYQSYQELYENYGASDAWRGPVGDVFLGETGGDEAGDEEEEGTSGDEYDTDIESDVRGPRRVYGDPERVYVAACRRLGVVPCSSVTGHLSQSSLCLQHRSMTSLEARALSMALMYNMNLTSLRLSHNTLGAEGVRCVTTALGEHDHIVHLDLSYNSLGSIGARCICDLLRSCSTLTSLSAAGNRFQENDAKCIADAMKGSKLRTLDLSHNAFREDGGVAIGKVLDRCRFLEELNLSWNHLRLKGALSIARGLQGSSSLRILDISWNGFANGGAKAIAESLKVNDSLRDLDLSCNRVNLEGAVCIGDALKSNTSLTTLKLSRNPITTSGALHIFTALKINSSSALMSLELLGIEINRQGEWMLGEVLSSRKLRVIHGGHVTHSDPYAKRKSQRPSTLGDPLSLMMEFVKKSGLRLFDFFAQLDKDNSMSVSRSEFKKGMKLVKVPLNEHQIDRLVEQLDLDHDGEISFAEFLDGQKRYRERERRRAALPVRPLSARLLPALARAKSPSITNMTSMLGLSDGASQLAHPLNATTPRPATTLAAVVPQSDVITSLSVPTLPKSLTK